MQDEQPMTDKPEKKKIEAPLDAYVKGGTPTAKSERLYEARFHEAEQRRDDDAAERAEAKVNEAKPVTGPDGQPVRSTEGTAVKVPGRQGGGVEYSNQFTESPEVPTGYLHFSYHEGNRQLAEGYADLLQANPDDPEDLMIVLVCFWCQRDGHKHQQDNQIRVQMSNKYFEHRAEGPDFFWLQDDATGLHQRYRSAGIIIESEPFECPDCGRRMRIVKNRVISD
jgi:hypothetical protein